MNLPTKLLALATSCVMLCGSAQAITIEFDYSYDTTGFFTADKRGVMEDVASLFERNLLNHFNPTASASIQTPTGGSVRAALPADTIRVYLGAKDWTGNTLGMGTVGASPLYSRPVGGMISFDTVADVPFTVPGYWNGGPNTQPETRRWYVDSDITTIERVPTRHIQVETGTPGVYWIVKDTDFYSVALHEMGHVLGLSHVSSNQLYNTYGQQQTPIMNASMDGERKYFTEFDWQSLATIGWQVASLHPDLISAVPEPSTYAMLLGGLGLIGFTRRRRR